MNVFIANAGLPSQAEVDQLQEWILSFYPQIHQLIRANLRSQRIMPCKAKMLCQIKTPGICAIKDDMQVLLPAYIHSDITIFISPLFCGGYSSEMKKFIDRLCPVLTACFEKRNGETWHITRYEKRPVMVGIGLIDDLQRNNTNFVRLFSRNMKQLNIHRYSSKVIRTGMKPDELNTTFRNVFTEAGI